MSYIFLYIIMNTFESEERQEKLPQSFLDAELQEKRVNRAIDKVLSHMRSSPEDSEFLKDTLASLEAYERMIAEFFADNHAADYPSLQAWVEQMIKYARKPRSTAFEEKHRETRLRTLEGLSVFIQSDNDPLGDRQQEDLAQDVQAGQDLQDKEKAEQISEELLLQELLSYPGLLNISLPPEYSVDGHAGWSIATDSLLPKNMNRYGYDKLDYRKFQETGIEEGVAIYPDKQILTHKELRTPAKKGFLGLGAREAEYTEHHETVPVYLDAVGRNLSHEPAYIVNYLAVPHPYQDYSRRLGQQIHLALYLPKSLALALNKHIEKSPAFLRKLAKEKMYLLLAAKFKHNRELFNKVWEEGDKHTGYIPLKPPVTGKALFKSIEDLE